MISNHFNSIATELNISVKQVENTLALLQDGATIPFISRYRKERTGSLDEVQIAEIQKKFETVTELEKRRESILHSIEEQEKLTPELKAKIEHASTLTELEDLYLPYKPKRKTKASVAREKGLEPLADIIFQQKSNDVESLASKYLNENVETIEDALQGARDIIAEWINEDTEVRDIVRGFYNKFAEIESKLVKGKEEEGQKYKDYFAYIEPLKKCPSHRLLAMFRGEEEGVLKISIAPDNEKTLHALNKKCLHGYNAAANQVKEAVEDAYKRLLQKSIENETRKAAKEKADEEAIKVFSENLKQLLLAPPLGQHSVLAIDPGYRTGCKVVCLDKQGNLLHNETIYPHPPQNETGSAIKKIKSLVNAHKSEAIAIGNGTASRETEAMIKRIKFDEDIMVFVVSENGASVYSASPVAREEFPQYDVTVRGAVSIGRRLMDPLAELVKIEPKSIGVGQYQHAVDQNKLKDELDRVVESAVNKVGVNINTASKQLLTYVSGLGSQLAANIVDYREQNGPFKNRKTLSKVPRLGPKAYEQAAGFLRIKNAENPLDDSAVHPESYAIVEQMAKDLETTIPELIRNKQTRQQLEPKKYVTDTTGLPTINDILKELEKPGLDPRDKIEVFEFSKEIRSINDLHEGMKLPGIINNITNFGAFVDIGIKENGLVHISQLADKFVSNPNDVVKLHQHVMVQVLEVDIQRKRIQLTMKQN